MLFPVIMAGGHGSRLWPLSRQGNSLRGEVLTEKVGNCLIHVESRLVTALGVTDLVIVETKDAVLVAHKDREQDVKQLVAQLALSAE